MPVLGGRGAFSPHPAAPLGVTDTATASGALLTAQAPETLSLPSAQRHGSPRRHSCRSRSRRRASWGEARPVSIPVLLPVLLTRRHRSSAVIVERQAARLEAVDVVRRYNRPSVNDGDGRRPAKPALIGLLIRGSSVRSRDGSPIFLRGWECRSPQCRDLGCAWVADGCARAIVIQPVDRCSVRPRH